MSLQLQDEYIARMRTLLKHEFLDYMRAMEQTPPRALRVNTLKVSVSDFLRIAPFKLIRSGMAEESFLIEDDVSGIGNSPMHRAGLFYMQEPSAARPAALLTLLPHMRVLDLCAAPGGKSTQIAAKLLGEGILVSNEIDAGRAAVLAKNIERMGIINAVVTSMTPEALHTLLPAYFDAVLVDAPCSGEGMFRREPQAVRDWSEAHVQSCALRQSHILRHAAGLLRAGGELVYSTCTFSREENEDVVHAFLDAHADFTLIKQERHYPHTGTGEGQFAALLKKCGEPEKPEERAPKAGERSHKRSKAHMQALSAFETFVEQNMYAPPAGLPTLLQDQRLMLLPHAWDARLSNLFIKSAGVLAGEWRKNRFVPAHALVMAHGQHFIRRVEPEAAMLARYLHGESISVSNAPSGYAAITHAGHALGLGKISGGDIKNLLPKGLRN